MDEDFLGTTFQNLLKNQPTSVGDAFGDGREWFRQAQPNNGDGAYVLWTDEGKVNRNFDASGNFTGEYAGAEDFGMKDLIAGGATILGGMGLGNLLSSAIAGGAAGAGAGAAGGAFESGTLANGVTIGGPMSTGLPAATSLPSMGAMAGVGTAAAAAGGGGAGGGLMSNPLIKGAIGAITGGAGGSGSGLGSVIAGMHDYNQQKRASDNMLDWLRSQQAKIDSIYDPQGDRAKFMWEEMSRKDAAAGRNSQYGPRTTDFLGKFGGEYAGHTANLSRGLAGNFSDAFNQRASAGSGLSAGIGNWLQSGGIGSLVENLSSVVNSNSGSSPVNSGSSGFTIPPNTFDIADWWSQ